MVTWGFQTGDGKQLPADWSCSGTAAKQELIGDKTGDRQTGVKGRPGFVWYGGIFY